MKRTLYIHIGAHKTATTAIQRAFWTNRDLLRENGVLYPSTNRYHFAQHRLGFALKGQRDPKRGDIPDLESEIEDLKNAIRNSEEPRIFISSESLFVTSAENMRRLRDAFSFVDVQIVAVVRRQDDYLLSSYNQSAKAIGNGFTRPLSHFAANPRSTSREIGFACWVRQWRQVFGAQSINLFRYEDGDPLKTMLNLLELPEDLIVEQARVNESVPSGVAEAVRLAKRLRLPVNMQKAVRKLAFGFCSRNARYTLSDESRRRILLEFEEENDALFKEFGMTNSYRPLRQETDRADGPE